jgi:hypothetical protein
MGFCSFNQGIATLRLSPVVECFALNDGVGLNYTRQLQISNFQTKKPVTHLFTDE